MASRIDKLLHRKRSPELPPYPWIAAAAASVLGAVGAAWFLHARRNSQGGKAARVNQHRIRQQQLGNYVVEGRTVTIDRPRTDLYDFWRDFSNLPAFMESLQAVVPLDDDRWRWVVAGPGGEAVEIEAEVITDRENEYIAWRSIPDSPVDAHGSMSFRDAPGGGTELEAIVAYNPARG